MSNEINDIDDLIGKVLAGEATSEEQNRVDAWVLLSDDNRKYVDQVKLIFEKASTPAVKLSFDADKAWKKVRAEIEKNQSSPFAEKEKSLWPALRIAAGIILVAGVGWFTYRWYNVPIQTFVLTSAALTLQDSLPDGSTAFLNKNSKLVYEFNPRQNTRKVTLKGEGFFEVKHDQEMPFIVESDGLLVRDIGTSFNVKAYPERDSVEVIVKTGEVQIYTLENQGLLLKAGETGIYSRSARAFYRIEKPDSNAIAYKTRNFIFNHENLKVIVERINEVYNASIKIKNEELQKCQLTVTFNNESLDTIVEIISETLNITVTREGKEIFLDGKGCQ